MKNPYFDGVSLARQSVKPKDNQQYDSMNKALLQLASSIGKRPMQNRSGFLNNISQFAPDFADANLAYQANQQQVEASNAKTLQEQINHEMKVRKYMIDLEQAKSAQEERLWHRTMTENQLAETKKQHSDTKAYQKELLDYKTKKNQWDSFLDQMSPIIRTDSAFDKVGKEAKTAAAFYTEVEEAKNKYEQLKLAMQEAGIDTTNPLAFNDALRNASSILSSFKKDPKLRNVASKYSDTKASFKRAMQTAEKAQKDSALTDFTVKYGDNHNLYPNLGKENYDTFEEKLNTMLHDAKSGYEAAELSMQLGRHVNKKNYHHVKQYMIDQNQNEHQNILPEINDLKNSFTQEQNNEKNFILMQDESGQEYNIPIDEAEEAVRDGLIPLGGGIE